MQELGDTCPRAHTSSAQSWEDEIERGQRLEEFLNTTAMTRIESLSEMEENVTILEREVLWLTDECERLQELSSVLEKSKIPQVGF